MSQTLIRNVKSLSVCLHRGLWQSSRSLKHFQPFSFQHLQRVRFGLCFHFRTLHLQSQVRTISMKTICCANQQLSKIQRNFHLSCAAKSNSSEDDDTVNITYIDRDGESHHIKAKVGDNVMYLAQRHEIEIEGACEASLACCTCHVYVENYFDKLNELDEEEEDMLDLAPFLQENSRLSCQIILSKDLDGLVVRLPSATRNFYVDGHVPKPH